MKSDLPAYKSSSKVTDDNSDIKKLLSDFLNIWPWVLLLIFVNLLAAYFLTKTTTPVYQVQATMVINQDKSPISEDLFESMGLRPASNIENEISVMSSFTLAYNAIKELDFNVEYFRDDLWKEQEVYHALPYKLEVDWNHQQALDGEFEVKILNDGYFELSVKQPSFTLFRPDVPDHKFPVENIKAGGSYRLNEWIAGRRFRFRLVKTGDSSANLPSFAFRLRSNYLLAVQYSKMLQVEVPKKESTILALTIQTSMVEKGKNYLNKLIEVYQARELTNKNRIATNTATFINKQLESVKDSLVFFEDQLQRYQTENQTYNLDQQSNLVLTRLAALQDEKANAALKIKYYENVLNYLDKEQIDHLIVPSAVGIEEPVLDQLIGELITIQNDRLRLDQFLSADNRALKDLNFRYRSVLGTLKESIRRSYNTAKLSMNDLDQRIGSVNNELSGLPKEERGLLSIKRQSSISENIYTYLLQKRDEAEINKASNIPSSEVLDLARQIGPMISPKPLRNYLIAFSLGIILPLMLLFFRNLLNNKIYDSKLLEKSLSVPLLGVIGRSQKKENNNIVFDSPKSFVTENFRSIRASTQFLHPADESMVIAFTSSISGEGKTFCAINTAAIYALNGKRTILVGLDLRRPKIAEDFGLKNNIGVSNYLSGKGCISEMIKSSNEENLDILLSGPPPPNPAELIGSDRFAGLIETLRTSYEVIILDCPPAGLVSETIDIFKQSDLNFYIFRHMFSDWNSVDHLNALIEKGLIRKVYAIYNDITISADYSYGYHYHLGDVQLPLWKRLWNKNIFKRVKDRI